GVQVVIIGADVGHRAAVHRRRAEDEIAGGETPQRLPVPGDDVQLVVVAADQHRAVGAEGGGGGDRAAGLVAPDDVRLFRRHPHGRATPVVGTEAEHHPARGGGHLGDDDGGGGGDGRAGGWRGGGRPRRRGR